MGPLSINRSIKPVLTGLNFLALILLAVGSLLPGGISAQASTEQGDSPHLFSMEIYDYFILPPGEMRKEFSLSADTAVYVRTAWANGSGEHNAELTFHSPDDNVYQVLNVPFTATNDVDTVVWGDLPLTGPLMARRIGDWYVEVRLDGKPDVIAHMEFALTW